MSNNIEFIPYPLNLQQAMDNIRTTGENLEKFASENNEHREFIDKQLIKLTRACELLKPMFEEKKDEYYLSEYDYEMKYRDSGEPWI